MTAVQTKELKLRLDAGTLAAGEAYARRHGMDLSTLLTRYLREILMADLETTATRASAAEEISGVITLPEDFDERKAYLEHLAAKYA